MPPLALGIAAGVGGLASGAATLVGAGKQADAAEQATQAQLQANRENIEFQRENAARQEALLREFAGQARADLAPVREAQQRAISGLEGLSDPNSALFQQQRDIATKAIQRQLAAQGLLRSGQQGNQLQNLELGLAQQRASILQALAGTGATEATANLSAGLGSGLAGISQGLGQQIGSSFQQQGQLAANNLIAQGNIGAQKLGSLAGIFGSTIGGISGALSAGQQNDLLMSILGKNKNVPVGNLTTLMNPTFGGLS